MEPLTFSTFDARARLCELLSLAEAGILIVITNRGKPVAKLVPMSYQQQEPKKEPQA